MSDENIKNIARNVIAGFLLSLGVIPSESDDTLQIRDYGRHRVFTQQAKVSPELADSIEAGAVLAQLAAYLDNHNALPTAIRYYPYNVEVYICPCGCGTFLYTSIYHDAEL